MRAVTTDSLNKLAGLCLRIANYIDRHAEKNDTEMCDELRYSYLALSGYLREGVKAIVDIQSDYSDVIAKINYAEFRENRARNFLEEVFGDREIDCINESDKENIKAFIRMFCEAGAANE